MHTVSARSETSLRVQSSPVVRVAVKLRCLAIYSGIYIHRVGSTSNTRKCDANQYFVLDKEVQSEMEETWPIRLSGENNDDRVAGGEEGDVDFHNFMILNNSSQLTFVSHSGSFIAYDLMV